MNPANTPRFSGHVDSTGAYAFPESVLPGQTIFIYFPRVPYSGIRLHVSIERYPRAGQPVIDPYPEGFPVTDLGEIDEMFAVGCSSFSPVISVVIPMTAASGMYTATIAEMGAQFGWKHYASFVVRGQQASSADRVAVVIPTATGQAYNEWGGASLYGIDTSVQGSAYEPYLRNWDNLTDLVPARFYSYKASFERPFLGALPDGTTARNPGIGFSDYNRAADFLESDSCLEGAVIEYLASSDLHNATDPVFLRRYNCLVFIGHHEYWTWEMRSNVERFIADGGNVCFFCGNTCWWQVRFEGTPPAAMTCYKMEAVLGIPYDFSNKDPIYPGGDTTRLTTHWYVAQDESGRTTGPNWPENSLTGTSYRNGAFRDGGFGTGAYTVHYAKHWIYSGTGLSSGGRFGAQMLCKTAEADAAFYVDTSNGPVATGDDGGPLNQLMLATAVIPGARVPQSVAPGSDGRATMTLFRNMGVIFNAGVLQWHYYFDAGLEQSQPEDFAATTQITRNVLARLRRRGPWAVDIYNSGFQEVEGRPWPDGWLVEGPGQCLPESGGGMLVDASAGQMWISAVVSAPNDLPHFERFTRYRVLAEVAASRPNEVSFTVRVETGEEVMQVVESLGDGQFHTIESLDFESSVAANPPPFVAAQIVICVNAGTVARVRSVSLMESEATPIKLLGTSPIV